MKQVARAMPRLGEFIPTMQPTYASTDEVMQAHGGTTWAEIKHDGYRVQVHRGKRRLKIFTRNGNELNYACYPDIVQIAERLPTCIVDAEMVGKGTNHKHVFDGVKKRFRNPGIKKETIDKYVQSGIIEEVPLQLRVFDALRFERRGLLHLPMDERNSYIDTFTQQGVELVDQTLITGKDDLEAHIEAVIADKQEGIVCKNPQSPYRSGTSIDWVKFKRSETLDLVVVGFYMNGDRPELPFTSVLVAAYNDHTGQYETLGKIGTTREEFATEIHNLVLPNITESRPGNVAWNAKLDKDSHNRYVPDFYVDPDKSVVLEVNAMNLNYNTNWQSCGEKDGKAFSMRIGWVKQMRYDKASRQATTTQAIQKLYELQEAE